MPFNFPVIASQNQNERQANASSVMENHTKYKQNKRTISSLASHQLNDSRYSNSVAGTYAKNAQISESKTKSTSNNYVRENQDLKDKNVGLKERRTQSISAYNHVGASQQNQSLHKLKLKELD